MCSDVQRKHVGWTSRSFVLAGGLVSRLQDFSAPQVADEHRNLMKVGFDVRDYGI